MLVRRKKSDDPTVRAFKPSNTLSARIRRRMQRWRIQRELQGHEGGLATGYEPFHGDLAEFGPELLDWIDPEATVVNLHWVSRFLDYPAVLPTLVRRTPVVWTLHDMNLFTGGCHFHDGCGRFKTGCGKCPQIQSQEPNDPSRTIWARKKALFAGLAPGRLHFVAPSQWIAQELRISGILPQAMPISVIPYGLETHTFNPIPVETARDALGVPKDKKALLFVAESVNNRRKGFEDLKKALAHLDQRDDLVLLSLGKGVPELGIDIEHHHLGFVTDDAVLAQAYSAADVFAMPSQEDNLPATVLESLACGTPIAAFDTGGLPDMVRPGITGALADLGDHASFAKNLRDLLDSSPDLRSNCRTIAETEYPLALQAQRYTTLYESLLETGSAAVAV